MTATAATTHLVDDLDRADAGADAGEAASAARQSRFGLPAWWPVVTLGSPFVLWVSALLSVDPNRIGKYGLVSALPPSYFLALVFIAVGVAISLHRGARLPVVFAHATLFVLVVH